MQCSNHTILVLNVMFTSAYRNITAQKCTFENWYQRICCLLGNLLFGVSLYYNGLFVMLKYLSRFVCSVIFANVITVTFSGDNL